MRIRYYIDPATGLPHIYEHGISEIEIEEVLDNPTQDLRGQNHSRIAIGQTETGRYLKVVYAIDPRPDSVFVNNGVRVASKSKTGCQTQGKEKVMRKNKYPNGWSEARIRKVIEYYDSQTDEEEAAEIEAALASTTMEAPKALVPVVRGLIATRKSSRARKRAPKSPTSANKSRAI